MLSLFISLNFWMHDGFSVSPRKDVGRTQMGGKRHLEYGG